MVFITDIGEEDLNANGYPENEQVTAAYLCVDNSSVYDFIREFENKADKNSALCCGYLFYYIRNISNVDFTTCAVKREGEVVELIDNDVLALSQVDKDVIRKLANQLSMNKVVTDMVGCYNYWDQE